MRLEFRRSFLKDIRKIKDASIRERLKQTIQSMEAAKDLHVMTDLKQIKGTSDYYRLRIGDYRLGLKMVDDSLEVIRFLPRGDIYKKFP